MRVVIYACTSLWRITKPACDALQELMATTFPECVSEDPVYEPTHLVASKNLKSKRKGSFLLADAYVLKHKFLT